MSPRISFENELKVLQDNVTDMVCKVEADYEQLFRALENQNEQEILRLLHNDKAVTKQQREIESQCLFLITRQQPIVGDLRVVTASLKVVTDIQRIGDHVSDMAELVLRLKMKDLSLFSAHIQGMITATREMFCEAAEAFAGRNLQKAREVISLDDVIDELFNKVKQDLIRSLKREVKDADECIDVLMIAKYLEKIGDHAVNICEWEIFRETGNMNEMRLL
ncbi:MAG: phosphate signaling complex protein PhoU [Lachnospiraceae bacterium]|nr:phosphate signaling complex protein PhoU [Lachnospiraceae bacterium]